MLDLKQINQTWTLFLDRDGVINEEKMDGYILNKHEFNFYPGAIEAIALFANYFGHILIVTNQRGIGRGLMQEKDLDEIHAWMLSAIESGGGKIDSIYFAPDLEDDAYNRKPNPGMAFQAKEDFPLIKFQQSIMVGNTLSDMRFGRNAGMKTVFIASTHRHIAFPHPDIDARFNSLQEFANSISLIKT